MVEAFFAQYGLYLWAISTVLIMVYLIVVQMQVSRAVGGYRQLMRGLSRGNLEEVLNRHLDTIYTNKETVEALKEAHHSMSEILQRTVQKTCLLRFQAFENTGGDQSFVVVLLDGNNNGMIITNLYGRAESRVFAKPVVRGASTYRLTEEEEQALAQAMGMGTSAGRR